MGPGISQTGDQRKIRRWEIIGGLCLIHGFRKGAELGVSHGRFTSFLCSIMDDLHMIAIDLWAPQERRDVPFAEAYANWDHDTAYKNFAAHCDQHLPGRVDIMRMRTEEAAAYVPDNSLDFVFIDADHTYEGAKLDIELWTPKVRMGGFVTGHDFNWPTVEQAVRETGRFQLAPDNVWLRQVK